MLSSVSDPAGEGDAQFVSGQREVLSACLDCGLLAIEDGEEWSRLTPPIVVIQERRAVRNGVGLTNRMDRYLAAYQRAWDFVLEEVGHSSIPDRHRMMLLREASRAAASLLTSLLREVTDVHFGELRRGTQTRAQRLAELVRKILAGEPVDVRELDYDFDVEHVGMIATGVDAEKALNALVKRFGRQLLAVPQDDGTVWAWLGGRPNLSAADIGLHLRDGAYANMAVVIGRPAAAIAGFRQTHRLAQAARLVARRGLQRITLYDDVELAAHAVHDDAFAISLVEKYIAWLDRDPHGAMLRQTLKAFFDAGRNEGKAAKVLGRHRHTVERRLDRVEKIIGRPLYTCYAAVEVALMLAELEDHSGESTESPWP
jgi:hypothetical protein